VGDDPWRAGERADDVPSAAAAGAATQKKCIVATERDETARAAWRAAHADLDPATLVFLDETSTHTAMTRVRARAPRGQRVAGPVPRNHGPNVTVLAALTATGIAAPDVQEGGTTGPSCTAYVEQVLVPTLRPGQTVLLDNLNVHKGQQIGQAIEAAGCHRLFLPTYSPDFTPIEPALATIKTRLRQAAARTVDDLVAAIRVAIDAVSAADARGFDAHCGYPLPAQLL
jgi:transposase